MLDNSSIDPSLNGRWHTSCMIHVKESSEATMASAEPIVSSSGRPMRRCRAQQRIGEGGSPHPVNSARKRSKRNSQLVEEKDQQHDSLVQRKKTKISSVDIFSSHMTDDTFLFLLRYFVADSGLVDGDSIGSIMCVSKQWYAVASSRALWTQPVASLCHEEESKHNNRRPSPLIREVRLRPQSLHLSNLVGFSNLGRRTADIDRALSYTVRERATGVLFNIDILDADDYRFIRSAASAHRLVGDDFLKRQNDDCSLYLPVGIDFSNGKVVRWFEYADPLPLWFRRFSQSVSPSVPVVSSRLTLPLPVLKNWFRQIFQAVRKIHATGAAHGSIVPRYIYLVSSDEPSTTSLKIACPSLFPIVSADVGSIAQDWKYTCPEVLLARSKGLTSVPTPSGDIWSIGCILAEIVRQGVPLFGKEDWDDKKLRKISRMVGRPPSQRPSLRSDFPLDSMENLRRELKALDKEGLDFIKQLLSPDPQKRPTAEQALAHPFLSLSEVLPSRSIASSGLEPNRELISLFLSWESQNQLSPTRKRLRVDAWATLVDYIIEIVHVFDLKVSAAFRAMDYFDRFFSSYSGLAYTSRMYQLIAGTCLYIASMCDTTMISKTDLAFCADNIFDRNDVLIAEVAILRGLDFRLSYPTCLDFVELYSNVIDLEESRRLMSRYIAELALQCQINLKYPPSLVASCVVALALFCVGTAELWPTVLEETTGYSWLDLEQCMVTLSSDIHHVRSTIPELKIITRRYRRSLNGGVALVHIPRITSFATLGNPRAQHM